MSTTSAGIAPSDAVPGLIVAAPSSDSGKTVLTLGLLHNWQRSGVAVAPFKSGPDYIDAAFHSAAAGQECINLDIWAMREETLNSCAGAISADAELVVGEGVMGLFDGAVEGGGATADLAAHFALPVVLVVDVRGQGASVAALVEGFANHRGDVQVAAVILNHVASARHEAILRAALAPTTIPVLGAVPQAQALALPARHLGLTQAVEKKNLQSFLSSAADLIAHHVDCDGLQALAQPLRGSSAAPPLPVAPLGKHIAVARDSAFSFCYEAVLVGWQLAGASLSFFSPLEDEPPNSAADAIYLPGGYPELHAAQLAANQNFLNGLRRAAKAGVWVYGECGGFMVLGNCLIDRDGERHAMAGLLPVETSFANPRRHLGYRAATLLADAPFDTSGTEFRGHEFHYATITQAGNAPPLFRCQDSSGNDLGESGSAVGKVLGSFIHLIDFC